MSPASPGRHDRRRGTTRLRAAGFWVAFVATGIGGIKAVDRLVGLSTDWVDAAIAAPPRAAHR
jgi:hypothetical protein